MNIPFTMSQTEYLQRENPTHIPMGSVVLDDYQEVETVNDIQGNPITLFYVELGKLGNFSYVAYDTDRCLYTMDDTGSRFKKSVFQNPRFNVTK